MATRILPLATGEFQDFLELCVRDNGIGIKNEDLGKLFQNFQQIDSSLAREYDGSGLGLALVNRLAHLHGGTVGVASAPGRGTQFTVWLPWRKIA
jgi:signal transduction histidine kinase